MEPAADPDAYVEALEGWQRALVKRLRTAARSVRDLDERIKWGHLVYSSNGPVMLIRAAEDRVLFGFWRGARLLGIEPRLRRGGKYEMATLKLKEGDRITAAVARRLAREAVALNETHGDPTKAARARGSKR